ncbi:MAG: energy transducer TonB [Fibromonadaceae bacterium]|jgi:protein TonB|nr:energy transducer TonB [Fibromonadaceae bacterium]
MGGALKYLLIVVFAFIINAVFFLAVPILNALFFTRGHALNEKDKIVPREIEILVQEPKKEIPQRVIREIPQSNQFRPNQAQSSLNKGIKGFSMDLSLAGVGEGGVSIGSGGMENVIFNAEEVEVEAKLLREVFAQYPAQAKRRGVSGYVNVYMVIDRSGNVAEAFVTVVEPAGFGFETEALNAVRQYKFSPALVGGVPVQQRFTKEFRFVP